MANKSNIEKLQEKGREHTGALTDAHAVVTGNTEPTALDTTKIEEAKKQAPAIKDLEKDERKEFIESMKAGLERLKVKVETMRSTQTDATKVAVADATLKLKEVEILVGALEKADAETSYSGEQTFGALGKYGGIAASGVNDAAKWTLDTMNSSAVTRVLSVVGILWMGRQLMRMGRWGVNHRPHPIQYTRRKLFGARTAPATVAAATPVSVKDAKKVLEEAGYKVDPGTYKLAPAA